MVCQFLSEAHSLFVPSHLQIPILNALSLRLHNWTVSAIILVLNTAHDSIRSSRYPGITSTSIAVSSRHEPCQMHVFFTPHLQIWALKIENSIGCWTPVAVNKKKRPTLLDYIILWELIIHLIKNSIFAGMVTDFGPMKQGCCPLLGTDAVNHMSERSEWSFDVIIKLSHRPMWGKITFPVPES